MIWYIILAYIAGAITGVFLIALVSADKDRDDEK